MESTSIHILYVEDNEADRMAFSHEAREAAFPFQFDIAESLQEAMVKLKEKHYQAVVADFFLGDGEATELFPYLGESPLIIITGGGTEERAVNALQAGAYDYLIKDINYNYLKIMPITVIKTIEQKKQRDELNRYRTELEKLVAERTIELIAMIEKVKESETNFRNIFNGTSDGMFISDKHLHILETNDTFLKQLEINQKTLPGDVLRTIILPAISTTDRIDPDFLRDGMPVGNFEIELRSPASGKILPVEISSVPVVFNRKPAVLTIVRDITERKFLARRLIETIIQTEEAERSRIAKDLHDEIGPLLSALKIYMTSFIENRDVEKRTSLAGSIGMIIRDLIESVKDISNDMSPHILVNFGLLAAIQNISDLFSRNITIHLQANIDQTRFQDVVESVVYRIIKELVNNTVKHAKAEDIYINLQYHEPLLECFYQDNGIGFDLKTYNNKKKKGMGLNNIISRVRSLGGNLEIKTDPGKGFAIHIVLKSPALHHVA